MERGRILIMGENKETTYEIRSLLDNQKFELEIALSSEVGKLVLDSRQMNLVMIHSGMIQKDDMEFRNFVKQRSYNLPVALLGNNAVDLHREMDLHSEVQCFVKPYRVDDIVSFIKAL